ncbi:MAG: N-carbamoyl-D-amino-acid hydrolase [Alphaproteobacteria bacterium]|nr:N-carbamoyl-D-amino-acid hydrolase [Alphaproteobacteria bacterium]
MSRIVSVGGAQLGPIHKADRRADTLDRLIALLEQAAAKGCDIVVFPELALTTFFPRWYAEDIAEMDCYFETAMPNPAVQPLFDRARALRIGFHLGYAELEKTASGGVHRYNTAILVDKDGTIVGKYRKVHLPGHRDYDPGLTRQHLEKRYFEPGDLGFPVWRSMGGIMGLCICNDRRWPETWRCLGLQGVELVMLGYNTPTGNQHGAAEPPHQRMFHNHLSVQAGAYQNATWAVAVAKAGIEDGHELMGGSVIVSPQGEIVAQAYTQADELIAADCDLDLCAFGKSTIFNFAAHRRPEHYGIIAAQAGATPPPEPGAEG